jgi:hypothetical protein
MMASASVFESDTGGGQHRQSEGKQQPWAALGNAGKRERGGSAVVTGSPLATMKKTWRSTSDYALDISGSASLDSLDSLDSLEVQIGSETYELGEIEFWLEVRVQETCRRSICVPVCVMCVCAKLCNDGTMYSQGQASARSSFLSVFLSSCTSILLVFINHLLTALYRSMPSLYRSMSSHWLPLAPIGSHWFPLVPIGLPWHLTIHHTTRACARARTHTHTHTHTRVYRATDSDTSREHQQWRARRGGCGGCAQSGRTVPNELLFPTRHAEDPMGATAGAE